MKFADLPRVAFGDNYFTQPHRFTNVSSVVQIFINRGKGSTRANGNGWCIVDHTDSYNIKTAFNVEHVLKGWGYVATQFVITFHHVVITTIGILFPIHTR